MTASQSNAPSRGIFAAAVVANRILCDEHHLLQLAMPADFPPSRAGQFVQLACGSADGDDGPVVREWPEDAPPKLSRPELAEDQVLLRRPFSLAGRIEKADGAVLEVILRDVGRGSHWLAARQVGDTVGVLGPLGNAFTWSDDMDVAILVGGGVGVPPMIYLTEALHRAGKRAIAFVGATSANLLPVSISDDVQPSAVGCPALCVRELAHWGAETVVSTDDGSAGFQGFVTDALWRWVDQGRVDPAKAAVFTCGPEPMMQAVAEGAIQRGMSCQVAMERKMACGMGTCQSCVCKVHSDVPEGFEYKLVCTDGTIFDGRDLIWQGGD